MKSFSEEANYLYQKSKAASEQLRTNKSQEVLTGRIISALTKAGYKKGQDELDLEHIKSDIENGQIWMVRNLGPTTIRKLCQWVIEQENKASR